MENTAKARVRSRVGQWCQSGIYRWVVLFIIFIIYTLASADRANLGMALPYIKREFNLSHTDEGIIAGLFFTCYAIGQIPCGLIYRKATVRVVIAISAVCMSVSTWLVGHATSVWFLKVCRAVLGFSEAPLGIGCGTTINNWFPPREKGTAMGIYFAAMKCGPVIVPPVCAFIILAWGWRALFIACAVPGVLFAVLWFLFISSKPEDSRWVSARELAHIRSEDTAGNEGQPQYHPQDRCPRWVDRVIRRKALSRITTTSGVFLSWNIIGSALGFLCMSGVINTIMAWIPTYLMTDRGFSTVNTGFIAAAPFLGAVIGNMLGGVISDRVFVKRRKPLMMISAVATAVMMLFFAGLPSQPVYIAAFLFVVGVLLNLGYSAFVLFPTGLTDKEVYPLAYSLVNTGGSVGGALVPWLVGVLLDKSDWNHVFLFLSACSLVCLFVVLTMSEPLAEKIS
ncbi:MFS transporter [Salmonella enterica subsp. enterica serovar Newport]|nr:MFS transporter [Salmonella enterica subsp. enterica serovar Newport]